MDIHIEAPGKGQCREVTFDAVCLKMSTFKGMVKQLYYQACLLSNPEQASIWDAAISCTGYSDPSSQN